MDDIAVQQWDSVAEVLLDAVLARHAVHSYVNRLTQAEKDRVYTLHQQGVSAKQIAKQLKMAWSTVYSVIHKYNNGDNTNENTEG